MSTSIDLSGKIALVTGAGRGIGREIALALAAAGASVAINDFAGEDACAAVAGEVKALGPEALVVMGDVGDEESVTAMVDRVESDLGPIEIVVNNAGITRDNVVMLMSPDEFDAVIRTHLRGTFLVSKAVSRKMLRRRSGSIVNISSVVGRRGNAGQANYAAAKAGIIGLTKSLAKELGRDGITVNLVALGFIETAHSEPEWLTANRDKIVRMYPLRRLGKPADVAPAVVFLASDAASWITGQVLSVSGGYSTVG